MREPSKDVLCVKVDPEPGDLIPVQPIWVPAGGTGPGGCRPGARTPLACLAVTGDAGQDPGPEAGASIYKQRSCPHSRPRELP